MPFASAFGSALYERGEYRQNGIGERDSPRPWRGGSPPRPVPAVGLCGTEDQWQNGALTSDTAKAGCCPQPANFAGGSTSIGGTGTAVNICLPNSIAGPTLELSSVTDVRLPPCPCPTDPPPNLCLFFDPVLGYWHTQIYPVYYGANTLCGTLTVNYGCYPLYPYFWQEWVTAYSGFPGPGCTFWGVQCTPQLFPLFGTITYDPLVITIPGDCYTFTITNNGDGTCGVYTNACPQAIAQKRTLTISGGGYSGSQVAYGAADGTWTFTNDVAGCPSGTFSAVLSSSGDYGSAIWQISFPALMCLAIAIGPGPFTATSTNCGLPSIVFTLPGGITISIT